MSSDLPAETPAAAPPQQMGAAYGLGRFLIAPLARAVYRPHVEGRENVPRTGPVIFASNHLSFIDSIAIPVAAPRPVHFLAKSAYFEKWASRQFFTAIGAIAVERGAGQKALDALDQQRVLLEDGRAVALYPRARAPRRPALQGPHGCRLPRAADRRPRGPVGLIGTDKAMPVGAKFPSTSERITVRFGEPLDLSSHGPATSGRARRGATDEIMAAIHALSGQELANAYNEAPAQNPIERIKQVLPHERL